MASSRHRTLTWSDRASRRQLLFVLFFISGFCGLVYQVVWTRLAFAAFGIITPVLSVVISVFMLGLAVGSWVGGRRIGAWVERSGASAIIFYAGAELIIGAGAFVVPALFGLGEHVLLAAGPGDSARYLALSAVVLAISVLPWCVCMGATFPLMMAYVREWEEADPRSFSYLYLPNVLGAVCGTLATALVLIELLGFRHTLWVAAAGNFTIAFISFELGRQQAGRPNRSTQEAGPPAGLAGSGAERGGRLIQWILFSTGFSSMALEVAWVRAFAPVVKTQVYSFALVLASYLMATFLGSWFYRYQCRSKSRLQTATLLALLCTAAFLPIVANDARVLRPNWGSETDPVKVMILLASIWPLCALLGYLTPSLVDECGRGSPAAAGKAYALNVLGCILGPLAASYLLLPWLSDRFAQLLLGLPFVVFFLLFARKIRGELRFWFATFAAITLAWAVLISQTYEEHLVSTSKRVAVRRDYAASVLSFEEADRKHLLVNGIGMTALTPVTKFMVHLPLAFHRTPPESALVICFGMGTSFRSALSWGIQTTTVELVPSVPAAFGFYHPDAQQVLENPKGHIVIDDGRRFLCRTRDKFDVIVIDPPPPVEAAGSSLLYSREFYELAKLRLKPGGILQAWYPEAGGSTFRAVLRSVSESFPYVRSFDSLGKWGRHMLASMEPIAASTAAELAARMPDAAKEDLLEWSPAPNVPDYLQTVLSAELKLDSLLDPKPRTRVTDDRPFNEYFLLRKLAQ
jgi:spermidine synthase